MPKEDFVNVQLTEFGKERAAGGRVQIHAGNHSFVFEPGEVKMVTRAFDWNRVLKNEHFNGHPLFEIVPDAIAPGEKLPSATEGTQTTEVEA
jgi:hypothetical protein